MAGYGNPPGCHTGAYQDHYDYDNRLWAAAELYRATGERQYAAFIENWYHGDGPRDFQSNSGAGASRLAHAMDAYAGAAADGLAVDATIVWSNRRTFLRRAEFVLRLVQSQPFSTGDRLDVPEWIGWGKFTYGSRVVITLFKAWKLTDEPQYLDAAHLAIGPQYGAHPLSMSFVTGLGERYPRNPTCEVCLADDVDEPYPGLPIFGVFAHLSNGHPFYKIANHDANNFPYIMYSSEDRPVLTRYIDHKQIIPQSEFTISTMSHTLVAVGLLAKRVGRLHVHNATLLLDDGSTWGSLRLHLTQPYILPTNSCTWLFDSASLSALGAGASCSSGKDGTGGGRGTMLLHVQLGSGASVVADAALTTRGPQVGYDNYETRQWQQTVVVTLQVDGGEGAERRLSLAKEEGTGDLGPGESRVGSPHTHRQLQSVPEAGPATGNDAASAFGALVGAPQVYDSGVMLTTNSSAPEPPVSSYGAVSFDALALRDAQSSVGMQVDFSRGAAPEGGQFACPGGCSGQGACLTDIGECMCLLGTSGESCEIAAPPPPAYPPFAPLSEGESVVTVVASTVMIGITVAGSVDSFDDDARASLTERLRASLRCHDPSCFIKLYISPGSVQVAALLIIPDAVARSATIAADVAAAANTLTSSDSSSISSILGVSVTAITPPSMRQAVSVPLVVAPPPPPLPAPLGPFASDGPNSVVTIMIGAAGAVITGGLLILVTTSCLRRWRRSQVRAEVQMDCLTTCFPPELKAKARAETNQLAI